MIHMFCKDLMPDALRDSTLSIYLGLEFALGVHWLGNQKAYGTKNHVSCLKIQHYSYLERLHA